MDVKILQTILFAQAVTLVLSWYKILHESFTVVDSVALGSDPWLSLVPARYKVRLPTPEEELEVVFPEPNREDLEEWESSWKVPHLALAWKQGVPKLELLPRCSEHGDTLYTLRGETLAPVLKRVPEVCRISSKLARVGDLYTRKLILVAPRDEGFLHRMLGAPSSLLVARHEILRTSAPDGGVQLDDWMVMAENGIGYSSHFIISQPQDTLPSDQIIAKFSPVKLSIHDSVTLLDKRVLGETFKPDTGLFLALQAFVNRKK